MARKRAKGEGTIRKRTDGLWEARLSVPGRRTPKSFYGKTQAEALRKRDEAKAQVDRGIERSLVGECNETVVEKRGAYRQLRALHGKTGIVVPRDLFESDE